MKRWGTILIIGILLILIVVSFFAYRRERKETAEEGAPTPTVAVAITTQPTATTTYCQAKDLVTLLTSEGAAGSIYGTFTIKNASTKPCTIIGNNKIDAVFTASNIFVTYKGTGPATIQLAPGQTVYAQVHYPNGPQCNGPIKTADISFQYTYAPEKTITFKNNLGNEKQQIAACADTASMTEVTLWPFSTTAYH